MKKLLKKLLPMALVKPLLPVFHWLQALMAIIRYGWPSRGMNIIGITGTNGKTTTAALLGKIVEANGWKVGINSTAFYQIGSEVKMNDTNMTVVDPFRLNELLKKMKQAKVDWVILETTSHALSQHRTLGVKFKVAAITNLTQDHLDYHLTMDNYAEAKGRLFKKGADYHVINRDDEWFAFFDQFNAGKQKLTYGVSPDADCRIVKANLGPSHSKLELKLERALITPTINLVGKFNCYNALCAATIATAIGVDPDVISSGLESLVSVPGRMETVDTKKGFKVVIDYAHTPDALENVLEALHAVTKKRLITVFGATGDRDRAKRPIMGKIVARMSDIAIVTDDDSFTENPITIRSEVLHGAHEVLEGAEVYEVPDRRAAIAKAVELAKRGDTILLAGIGHQRYRVMGDQKIEWSERGVVEELLG